MFKVKVGEDEYEVMFWHSVPNYPSANFYPEDVFRQRFGTTCQIQKQSKLLKDVWSVICEGKSNLSIHDNFDRNVGRKISLARALQKLFPRDQIENRLTFWQAYYEARGGKW